MKRETLDVSARICVTSEVNSPQEKRPELLRSAKVRKRIEEIRSDSPKAALGAGLLSLTKFLRRVGESSDETGQKLLRGV